MKHHHPDVKGSDGAMAQKINAAYALLQTVQAKEPAGPSAKDFGDAERSSGFTTRKASWKNDFRNDSEVDHEEAFTSNAQDRRGLHAWDPWEEELVVFLKKVNQKAVNLLEETEEACDFWLDSTSLQEIRLPFQTRLFHILARQYIRPLETLTQLVPHREDESGRIIFELQAKLGGSEQAAIKRLRPGDYVIPTGISANRLYVSTIQGNPLGYLSFEDDALYYTVIPIVQAKACQIRMTVDAVQQGGKTGKRITRNRKAHADIDLQLRMEKNTKEIELPDAEAQIRKVLEAYKAHLATLQ